MTKRLFLNTLLIAVCFQFVLAETPYDFKVYDLYYQITSDSTVALSGIDDSYYDGGGVSDFSGYFCIDIPSVVSYNGKNYEVNAISDSALYDRYYIGEIIIPESVTSIGKAAFKECYHGLIIKCLSLEPPVVNDSFDSVFVLLVHDEVIDRYKENYESLDIFEYILCFDGTSSIIPSCQGYTYGNSRGCVLVFENYGDDTIIYERQGFSMYYGWYMWEREWDRVLGNTIIIDCSGNYMSHYYRVEAFAVVDNHFYVKMPVDAGSEDDGGLCNNGEAWDFGEDGIAYRFECAYPVCGRVYVSFWGYDNDGYSIYSYYAGKIVIPNSVHFAIWDYDLVGIGHHAFSDCLELNSVTMPETIEIVGFNAFSNCPNLTSITCLGKVPPSCEDDNMGFSELNYQNITLYVPYNAIEAYRNAPGWCNFQNIVGFYNYDFETDGLYFKITGEGEVVLTAGLEPYNGSVMVPTGVTYNGVTYTVTGIANGAFANAELTNLYIPVTIDYVGSEAFADCQIQSLYITGAGAWQAGALNLHVTNLFIDSGVTGLAGLQVEASVIYCYATVPPTCDGQTFLSCEGELHVPASTIAAYFTAPYWCNFLNITGDVVKVTEFTLSDTNVELPVGSQTTLRTTIKPANASPAEVTWHSSNEAVATVTNGAVMGVAAGECDIIAICQSQSAVCHVVVYDIPPTGITISQESAKMELGSQLTLTATVLPEDATDKTVTWLSDNEAVATVADGVVSAVGTGQCNITAYCGEFQATCHVIVVEHLIYITLDKHEVDLLPNHILTLTPTVSPVSTDLAVTSANPNVAAVRLAGNRIQVVGIAEGTTTIYVNSADGYAEGDSCEVTVITEIGDVNNDGFVDINDVTALIDRVLGKNQPLNSENADVNYDGNIDINDVTELIGFLLGVSQLEPKDHHIVPYTVNGVTFKMVRVTGGTFMMGATPEQGENTSDKEKPVHQVTLSSFSISQTEVTQELWDAVMGTNPSYYTGDMQCPVESVSWNDCQAFIAQLNQLTGEQFRLPTEAEWEFAARGGNKSQGTRYAGSNIIDDVAWYNANSTNTTHPVALKTPNELGLFDMTGNVWEWCNDWYKRYTAEAQTDPTGPETGNNRVLRGGCWNGDTNYNRISYRDNFTPTGSNSSGGLRLAL